LLGFENFFEAIERIFSFEYLGDVLVDVFALRLFGFRRSRNCIVFDLARFEFQVGFEASVYVTSLCFVIQLFVLGPDGDFGFVFV
jgi:hypothetical protein